MNSRRYVLAQNIDVVSLHFCSKKSLSGYGLALEVEKVFQVRLSVALIYASLARLERDGLVSHCMVDGKSGRKTCSFVVTEKGSRVLFETVEDLRFLVKVVGVKL